MDLKELVMERLKPKTKALGFSIRELRGIAAQIADNLHFEKEPSEEDTADVNVSVDSAIDAVLPYLTIGQSQANRLLDEWKREHPAADATKAAEKEESGSREQSAGEDSEPSWFRSYREAQEARFAALEGQKTEESRKARLDALLKDTGTYGERVRKSFGRMTFKDDGDFDAALAEAEADLKAYNQERTDAGLSVVGMPVTADKGKQAGKEVLTDKEVDDLVGTF